jgi:preprotein translocase subunit SecE
VFGGARGAWERNETRSEIDMLERIRKFLAETKVEMGKVTWPTRAELKESTKIVIVATFIVTIFIGFIDGVLTLIVRRLLGW